MRYTALFLIALPDALIGAVSHSERWETVPMDHAFVTLTPRGAGLGLSLAFLNGRRCQCHCSGSTSTSYGSSPS